MELITERFRKTKSPVLDQQTIETVQASIPLLLQTGPKFAAHFYDRVFAYNPELMDIFNMSNQRNGNQRRAIFNAIATYAASLEDLDSLVDMVEKIAQKHTSFLIKPKHYEIVGVNLIASLDEMFSPGQEVLDAWTRAYAALVNIFVKRETQIYKEDAKKKGGWDGLRKFRIAAKVKQSDAITRFDFEPVDKKAVADYKPGQYVGIWIKPEGFVNQEIRQYSLCQKSNGKSYRIAVKHMDGGLVSSWLHEKAQEGDLVDLVVPVGDFFLDAKSKGPVTLISGGVGQTPLLAMLEALSQIKYSAPVTWFHAAKNGSADVYTAEVKNLGRGLKKFSSHVWYSEPSDDDRKSRSYDSEGRITLYDHIEYSTESDVQYYICGPVGFMQTAVRQLVELGVKKKTNIHYTVFGPHTAL